MVNKQKVLVDENLFERLRNSGSVEIFLFKTDATLYKNYENTFISSVVLIKTDSKELFRIEGGVEDFGADRDEISILVLKEGWINFEINESEVETKITFGSETLISHNSDLIHYGSALVNDFNRVNVKRVIETIEINNLERYDLEVDDAIIIECKNQTIYIGRHIFPYSIVVTTDTNFIETLK